MWNHSLEIISGVCIYPTPLPQAGYDTKSVFKWNCKQSWTSPGGNTPQDSNCTATCLLSRKLFTGGARGVIVIVVGNGHGDSSSNPGRDWLHFT